VGAAILCSSWTCILPLPSPVFLLVLLGTVEQGPFGAAFSQGPSQHLGLDPEGICHRLEGNLWFAASVDGFSCQYWRLGFCRTDGRRAGSSRALAVPCLADTL